MQWCTPRNISGKHNNSVLTVIGATLYWDSNSEVTALSHSVV